MDDIKNMGFVVPDNLGSIMWNDELDASGNIVEKGEISKLIDIIDYLKGDGSFLLMMISALIKYREKMLKK